jgi:uncharacterized protein (TIGR04222 family)
MEGPMSWMGPFSLRGPEFLAFWGVGAAGVILVTLALRHVLTGARASPAELEALIARLHGTDIAYLGHGIGRAIEAAVAGLVHRGALVVDGRVLRAPERVPALSRDYVYRGHVDDRYAPVERYVLERVRNDHVNDVPALIRRAGSLDRQLTRRMRREGLRSKPGRVSGWVYAPGVLWLSIGVGKLAIGVGRARPIGALLLLLVIGGWALTRIKPRRLTTRGDQLLRTMRRGAHGLAATARSAPQQLAGNDLALAYALFGVSIAGATLAPLMPSHRRVRATAASASGGVYSASDAGSHACGASCSGASCSAACGSGCGGCT